MSAPTVLITGASSGIGRALAIELAEQGWRVFGTVRSKEDGQRLQAQASGELVPLQLDLRDAWQVHEVALWVSDQVGGQGLHALVNNAGIAATGPVEHLRAEDLQAQFDVNVFGAVALTRALLPSLRLGQGRVLNIGSPSGRVTLPFVGAYSASKAALAALTSAMRLELAAQGIAVSLIESGNVKTSIWDKTIARTDPSVADDCYRRSLTRARQLTERMAAGALPPDRVVRVVMRALRDRRPRAVYLVGHDARFWRWATRIVPAGLMELAFLRLFHLGRGLAHDDRLLRPVQGGGRGPLPGTTGAQPKGVSS